MSKSLTINAPQIVQTRNTLNAVPSGSTAEPDYNVKFVPQDLTEEQQAQARQNIGAISESEIPASAQANWNETDTESPAYIQNKPTIPAAPVQSNWNESDTASLAYIQNKPTIAADEIQTHRYLHVFLTSTSSQATVNRKTGEGNKTYKDGVLITSGDRVSIGSKYQGAYYGVDVVQNGGQIIHYKLDLQGLTDNSVTYIERNCDQNVAWLNAKVPNDFAGKLIVRLHNRAYNKLSFGTGFEGPMNADITTFYDYYTWSSYQTDNNKKYVGKIVFPNVPVPTNTDTMDTIPDLQYCTGIYIHRSKVDDWKTWMTGLYVANTDMTPIFNKIVPYDFVAWYNIFNPEIVSWPTLPLTMTDENSNVISGDFVAQNITITPAV